MVLVMVTRMVRPFEQGRFFRLAAERMSLATAARSGVVGFSSSEGWAVCSGVFAYSTDPAFRYSGRYSDTYSDVYRRDTGAVAAVAAVAPTWQANTTATDADLTVLINQALNSAGYTRSDGTGVR